MRYWLMKTEPDTFGVDDLAAAPARHHRMGRGAQLPGSQHASRRDEAPGRGLPVSLEHCGPGIVAVMEVVKEGYPDKSAFDRKDLTTIPTATPQSRAGSWSMCASSAVSRASSRWRSCAKHAAKELKGMVLLRPGNRLSVMPVESAHWKFILSLV